MSEYSLTLLKEDDSRGTFAEGDLRRELEEYREAHPEDPNFAQILVWEHRPGSTVGTPRSPFDFVDER